MKLIYLLLASSFILAACGGGGESETSPQLPDSPTPANNLTDLSKYTGTLYYDSYWNRGFSSYSFQDQRETLVLGNKVYWETLVFISDDGTWLGYYPYDSQTSAIRMQNLTDDSQSYNIDLGSYINDGPPLLSPDGKMVLQPEKAGGVNWRLQVREGDNNHFTLRWEDLKKITDGNIDDWAWIDNDTIIFTSDSSMFIVPDVRVQHYEKMHDFSPYNGIGYTRISKDYTKLAYNKGGDLYVMDVNTEVEQKLTSNTGPRKSVIRNFAWSPDSQYIAFIIGDYHWLGGGDPAAGLCPTLHIIPANLTEPVSIHHGAIPDPNMVTTLQATYDKVRNVCIDGHSLSWNP